MEFYLTGIIGIYEIIFLTRKYQKNGIYSNEIYGILFNGDYRDL